MKGSRGPVTIAPQARPRALRQVPSEGRKAVVRSARPRAIEAAAHSAREPREPAERRPPQAVFVSVGLHALLVVALVRVLTLPFPIRSLLTPSEDRSRRAERISYFAMPKSAAPPVVGRSGGDGRPETRRQPRPPLVAPTEVPSILPPAPATPATPRAEEGTGPLIGSGGPTKGIRPSFSDPRVWVAPTEIVTAPKTPSERLDSAVASRVREHLDSMAAVTHVPNKFERGDWTVEKGGQKWGIDPKFIRLGKVSIPTAILGFLPMNAQANPIAYERDKALSAMRADIQWQAQRAMNEDEFRKAVRSIRERKERERKANEKREAKPVVSPEGR